MNLQPFEVIYGEKLECLGKYEGNILDFEWYSRKIFRRPFLGKFEYKSKIFKMTFIFFAKFGQQNESKFLTILLIIIPKNPNVLADIGNILFLKIFSKTLFQKPFRKSFQKISFFNIFLKSFSKTLFQNYFFKNLF